MRDDPGAAFERSALAWQRTALSLLAGSALLTRLTLDRLGWLALSSLVLAGPLAAWVLLESRQRYGETEEPPSRSGRAPLALAAATVVLAGVELAALLTG